MGEDAAAGRGQEERLGAVTRLLLGSPGKGQSCPRGPGSSVYRAAEPKDRNPRMTEERGGVEGIRTPRTPTRGIKSVLKVTRELLVAWTSLLWAALYFSFTQQLANEPWG